MLSFLVKPLVQSRHNCLEWLHFRRNSWHIHSQPRALTFRANSQRLPRTERSQASLAKSKPRDNLAKGCLELDPFGDSLVTPMPSALELLFQSRWQLSRMSHSLEFCSLFPHSNYLELLGCCRISAKNRCSEWSWAFLVASRFRLGPTTWRQGLGNASSSMLGLHDPTSLGFCSELHLSSSSSDLLLMRNDFKTLLILY